MPLFGYLLECQFKMLSDLLVFKTYTGDIYLSLSNELIFLSAELDLILNPLEAVDPCVEIYSLGDLYLFVHTIFLT